MANVLDQFDTASFRTAGATVIAYGIILAFLFVLVFLVPYAIFSAL